MKIACPQPRLFLHKYILVRFEAIYAHSISSLKYIMAVGRLVAPLTGEKMGEGGREGEPEGGRGRDREVERQREKEIPRERGREEERDG